MRVLAQKSTNVSIPHFLITIKERIDSFIQSYLEKLVAPPRLLEAMYHTTRSGGKCLRPALLLASSELFDVAEETAIPIAAAVELIHTYSLIHDDLPAMDNAPLRRGQPSCWRQFDEATAILAGDALLTLAFELLSAQPLSPTLLLKLIKELAYASGAQGMVGGQALDMQSTYQALNLEDALKLQSLKTGRLIAFSCIAGALLGNANTDEQQALKNYGHILGSIFQITDDLLDQQGNEIFMGKAISQDHGKPTIVKILPSNEIEPLLKALKEDALDYLQIFGERAVILRNMIFWSIARHF